jgi:hypothetical protein
MEETIDRQTSVVEFRQRAKSSVSETKDVIEFDRDKYELALVGKEQILKVSELASYASIMKANTNSAASDWFP